MRKLRQIQRPLLGIDLPENDAESGKQSVARVENPRILIRHGAGRQPAPHFLYHSYRNAISGSTRVALRAGR
jgi:hypothetical protein